MSARAVVALTGARDYFQVPLALAESDSLAALITDLYFDDQLANAFWPAMAKTLRKRTCAGIDPSLVRVSPMAAASFALSKVRPSVRLNWWKGAAVGALAGRTAARLKSPLLCYSACAFAAFENPHCRDVPKFLFQFHPHPTSVRRDLIAEIRKGLGADSLRREYEISLSGDHLNVLSAEITTADHIFAASSYTAATLFENGISRERVSVVPYGVTPIGDGVYERRDLSGPLKLIWIGSLSQRKGLSYLLDAIARFPTACIELTLCGRGIIDETILRRATRNVRVQINAGRDSLRSELLSSHLFVLPSITEGFGHSILEAMSAGVPALTTAHTCAPDIIHDNVDGYIVPIADSEAIAARLDWALNHREALSEAGRAAHATSRQYTWSRFREAFRASYAGACARCGSVS